MERESEREQPGRRAAEGDDRQRDEGKCDDRLRDDDRRAPFLDAEEDIEERDDDEDGRVERAVSVEACSSCCDDDDDRRCDPA